MRGHRLCQCAVRSTDRQDLKACQEITKGVAPRLADGETVSAIPIPAPFLRVGFAPSQRAAPGEVMVPWNEPEVKPVVKSIKRSTVKLPLAPENRPVPPVTVWISTIRKTPGVDVGSLCPTAVMKIWSPLAAV